MRRRGSKCASTLPTPREAANGGDCEENNKKRPPRLDKYEDLPEYLKDNEFIRDYYRCEWPLKDVLCSVFSLHNETLNIWTHLVGFLIFAWLTVVSLTEEMTMENFMARLFRILRNGESEIRIWRNGYIKFLFYFSEKLHFSKSPLLIASEDSSSNIPLWPWFVFLGGAMVCLIFSTTSHLFSCHSRRFYYFFWRLDYAGISLMIVGSFFAPIYYTFLDHPYWRFLYLSSITLIGILVVTTLLAPSLSSGDYRGFRAALFLCMGFSGVIPAAHGVLLHWDHPHIIGSLGYEIAMGTLYGLGAVFYVTRIPERWRPGAFDIVGHSHQIFHVFVVAAALTHCAATLIIMEWRKGFHHV
ncbi:heptahelical transmembrane protein 2-like [Dorcoceras hygrometricum]|uniref:Heptahelical transmembrane protein 2-like n=1 Tax=Dorcoceras hygrometricum TaxID=472368 RepID=A0A2Z7BI81_9LAMI|nr:heptahelical transmembrane protein 2-like [Dorcoceras hygrometricum]